METFDAKFAAIETHFAHLCAYLNDLSPSKSARVVSGGASAQWDFDGRSHTSVELDTMHHKGNLYIRVRVDGHMVSLNPAKAAEFSAFYAKTVAIAQECEQYLTNHIASESAVVGAPTL